MTPTPEQHPNHPGHSAADCILRLTVTGNRTDGASGGYACTYTGGHCAPGADCAARVREVCNPIG